jgi:CRISPR-associated protein Cmr4
MSNGNDNRQATAMLFLHAQTSLHPGSGTALGVVDLPIQRERHTQWPLIPGSALKGILRDACREKIAAGDELDGLPRYDDKPDQRAERKGSKRQRADATLQLNVVFGPPTAGAGEFAGALAVTDARILLFPVRSLRGVFAWVTCPAVLERLDRDLRIADPSARLGRIERLADLPNRDEKAACAANSPLLVPGEDKFVLEEMEFTREGESPAAGWLADHVTGDACVRKRLNSHLAVISDNDFGHFVRHATEIAARIGLDYERKTAKDRALFYQEFLPAETVFYTLVLANGSRRDGQGKKAEDILDDLSAIVVAGSVLQIGGDETTGKGLCTVSWLRSQPGNKVE